MGILTTIKAMIANSEVTPPSRLKGLVAAGAVAWGTQSAMKMTAAALEQRDAANAHLEELQQAIAQHTSALEAVSGQNVAAREAIVREVLDGVRAGAFDSVVKARAAALGWEPDDTESSERSDIDQPSDIGHEDQAATDVYALGGNHPDVKPEPYKRPRRR